MDLVERFHQSLHAQSHDQRGDSDLSVRLVRAAAAVLPVDGAGLGIQGGRDLRTPLAASEETAALAERLEFTVGHGPCLLSAELAFPVLATEEVLAQQWPVFHDLLLSQTPIHSVLALPLTGRLRGLGTLSLYLTDPTGVTGGAGPRSQHGRRPGLRAPEAGRRLVGGHPAIPLTSSTPRMRAGAAGYGLPSGC